MRPTVARSDGVVGSTEHDRVDEPADAAHARVKQRRRDPQGHEQSDVPRSAVREALDALIAPSAATPMKAAATSAISVSARFRKRSAKANGIVLIQDRQRERDRGVVSEQLDRPRRIARCGAGQMKRRHREGGERGSPEGAPCARLSARHRRQRHARPMKAYVSRRMPNGDGTGSPTQAARACNAAAIALTV